MAGSPSPTASPPSGIVGLAEFEGLVREHEVRLRRFLRRFVASDVAEDLAQETFVRAWRLRGTWRGEGSAAGWLLRIAWTTHLDSRRTDARQPAREERAAEDYPTAASSPPDLRLDVARAMSTLTDRERAAAELCFAQSFSHSEAAAILGLPLGTLKTLVARARARLIEGLEACHE